MRGQLAQFTMRDLRHGDARTISAAFAGVGWVKPAAQYEKYLAEQEAGKRTCLAATLGAAFAGYVTVNWTPTYAGSVAMKIPEIQDLNVLPSFRRRGIATQLLDRAEQLAAERASAVAIGVGLHPGYTGAQVLY